MKKRIAILAVNFSLITILVVAIIVGNVIAFNSETEINSFLTPQIVDQQALELSSSSGQEMSKRIVEEGAVLLKNDGALPLDYSANKQVNVFGWRSVDWIYGSEGNNASGMVAPEDGDFSKNVDIYKALNAYGVQYNKQLYDMYYKFLQPDHQSAGGRGGGIGNLFPLAEPKITDTNYYSDSILSYAKNYSDTAIVVIARMSGEGMECSDSEQKKRGPGAVNDTTRHYLEISTEEEALLKYCGENFKNVVVLMNMANPFECGFLDTIPGIGACMYIGFTGTRAASALPSLLYGDVSPSGRTVDTFAYDMFTKPGNVFYNNTYTNYNSTYRDIVEGIYIGYKWYETADVMQLWDDVNNVYGKGYDGVVQFPFGHGKSYTTFDWTVEEFSVLPGSNIDDTTKISVDVAVKNTGKYPGRDVVEAYITAPYYNNGIEKASVNLVNFNKTIVLNPGEEVTITLEADAYDFTSYDCYDKNENGHKGYELEKGTYTLKLMTDSHNIKNVSYDGSVVPAAFDYNVQETVKITEDPVTGAKVGNLYTGADAVDITPLDANDGAFTADIPWFTRTAFPKPAKFAELNIPRACTPSAMSSAWNSARIDAWDNATIDEFGDPVDTTPVTWGAKNGKMLAVNGGATITELGKKLGANFYDPEWESVLDQVTANEAYMQVVNYYGSRELESVGKPWLSDLDGPAQIRGFTSAPRGTGYPTMVVVAQTWNPNVAYEFGKAFGDDMVALGMTGVWGWAIDNHRSSWFGRAHESPSEDGYLSGRIIANAVKGLNTRGRVSFLKHFTVYGESGYSAWMSEQTMREYYLKSFRMAFVEGGALGAMTTYQGIGGEWSEGSMATTVGVLRKEWGFKGAITTDYIESAWPMAAMIRAGGNFAMGQPWPAGSYTDSSPIRLQHRMRELVHEILYMWLHADYNYDQYQLNPDEGDTLIVSSSLNSWSWWQPLVYSLDVTVGVGCALWGGLVCVRVFMKSKKKKGRKTESAFEGGV